MPPAPRVCLQPACLSAWHGLTPVLHRLRLIGNSLTYEPSFSIFQVRSRSSPVSCLKPLQAPLPPQQGGTLPSAHAALRALRFFLLFFKKNTLHLFCLHALGWCSSLILKGKKCSNPCSSMGTLQSLVNESCWVFKEGAGGAACRSVSSVGLAEVSGLVLASGFRS